MRALTSGRVSRKALSRMRKRMIAANFSHKEDELRSKIDVRSYEREMPEDFREMYDQVKRMPKGKKALARFKKFWGIMPTRIRVVKLPGPSNKVEVLVGMGRAGKGGKILTPAGARAAKGAKFVATDADGKRIMLLSGRNSSDTRQRLRPVGLVEETHYVPTDDQEDAGTFKRNKYWVHRHDDDGGKFPPVYQDQAGNYVYGPGTYRVTDWIRR
jgi:hypothetical protein